MTNTNNLLVVFQMQTVIFCCHLKIFQSSVPKSSDFSYSSNSQTKRSSILPVKSNSNFLSENINFHNNSDEKEMKGKENSNRNSSTLSLHISAYENSIEAAASGDLVVGGNDRINKEKCVGKKLKNIKQLSLGSSSTNSFEYPRQQPHQITNPEVMQFKASQQLLNVNQAAPSNTTGHQNTIINRNLLGFHCIPQNHFHQLQHPSAIFGPPAAKRSRENQNVFPVNLEVRDGPGMSMPRIPLPKNETIVNHLYRQLPELRPFHQQSFQVPVRNQAPHILPIPENPSFINPDHHPSTDGQLQHEHTDAGGQLQPMIIMPSFLLRNHIGYKILSNGGTMDEVKAAVSTKAQINPKFKNFKQKTQRLQMVQRNLDASSEDEMKDMNITYDVNEIANKKLVFPVFHDRPVDHNQHAHEKGTQAFSCYFCGKAFSNLDFLKLHLMLTYISLTFTFSSNTIKISYDLTASPREAKQQTGETEKLYKNRYVPSKSSKIYHPKKVENYAFSLEMDMSVVPAADAGLYHHDLSLKFLQRTFNYDGMEEKIQIFYKLWNTFMAERRQLGMLSMYDRLIEFIKKTNGHIQEVKLGAVWNVFLLYFKANGIITEKQFIRLSLYKNPNAK